MSPRAPAVAATGVWPSAGTCQMSAPGHLPRCSFSWVPDSPAWIAPGAGITSFTCFPPADRPEHLRSHLPVLTVRTGAGERKETCTNLQAISAELAERAADERPCRLAVDRHLRQARERLGVHLDFCRLGHPEPAGHQLGWVTRSQPDNSSAWTSAS